MVGKRMVAAVLACVIVILPLLNAAPASADRNSETAARVIIDDYNLRGAFGFGCDLVGYWVTTAGGYNQLRVTGDCSTGEFADDTYLRLIVDDEGPCAWTATEVGNIDETEFQTIGPGLALIDGTGCGPVTEICWQSYHQRPLGPATDWSAESCENWDVGSPPLAGPATSGNAGGCAYVSAIPTVETARWAQSSTEYRFRTKGVVPLSTVPTRASLQPVWRNPAGQLRAAIDAPVTNNSGGPYALNPTATGPLVLGVDAGRNWTVRDTTYFAGEYEGWELVGIQIYLEGAGLPSVNSGHWANPVGGFLGKTNGANCTWWFGQEIAGEPATSPYIPAGPEGGPPVGTPPDGSDEPPVFTDPEAPTQPSDGQCEGFSLTDPGSWAGAAMCMIVKVLAQAVGLLGDLISVVGGLVAALLSGLLELLTMLFVPSGDGFGGSMDSLRAMWDDGAGGQWTGVFQPPEGAQMRGMGVQSFGASSASGSCEGPTVDIGSLGLDSDVINIEPMQPFSACSGTTATVAENVRTWTGVGLVLGGGFKIFEMILGAFGAMRQVRIMSDHDWSGRR